MTRRLDVWLSGVKVGYLSQDEAGMLSFAYDKAYLLGRDSRAVSLSMPLQETPYSDRIVRPFFSGLLPDEGARQRLAAALGLSASNAFGLLEIIGGECAGALSLFPAGEEPPRLDAEDVEILDTLRLEKIIRKLRDRPLLGGEDGVRLSLAGAQDKLAVCVYRGAICLAKGGRPTTHILKPFNPTLAGTVENELFCLRLAARLRLPAARAEMRRVGGAPVLLVERYDREVQSDGAMLRLHQEDFCQALSIPPEFKYEVEGGPGIEKSLALVDRASCRPAADKLLFLRLIIFQYLVGNADAHGKNYALLYRSKTPTLAPLYDVLCTAVYPRLTKKLAMAIGGRSIPDTIQWQHWQSLVAKTSAAQRLLVTTLKELAERIGDEAAGLLQELQDQDCDHEILGAIRSVIRTRVNLVQRSLENR
jgi:serine/threonine-protein kinase HipA